jgi:hypothetical protein
MQLTFCPDNFWGHMKMAPELRVDLERNAGHQATSPE